VTLSPKGRAAWSAADPDYEKGLAEIASGLSPASRKVAEAVLQRLIAKTSAFP
jgi:DNA-binding MarR family transcriptional regulator